MTELKPCPFCGGRAYSLRNGDVVCREHCEAMGCRGVRISAWNNRPTEAKIKADAVLDALAYAKNECDWATTTNYKAVEFSHAVEEHANKLREQGE